MYVNSSMFRIASFGFILLLIWLEISDTSQHSKKFFRQYLEVVLFPKLFDHQGFLLYGITTGGGTNSHRSDIATDQIT